GVLGVAERCRIRPGNVHPDHDPACAARPRERSLVATGTPPRIAPTGEVHPEAILGEGVSVWDLSQIREGAVIGDDTVIGRNVYVDRDVRIGRRCKIQNNALVYWPAEIGDGVF